MMEQVHLGAEDKREFTRFYRAATLCGFLFLLFLSTGEFVLTFSYRTVPELSLVAFGFMATMLVIGVVIYGRTMLRAG